MGWMLRGITGDRQRAVRAIAVAALLVTGGCGRGLPNMTTMGGTGGSPAPACQPQPIMPQRMVRLTFYEIAASLGALISNDLAASVRRQFGLDEVTLMAFPPLESTREGESMNPSRVEETDAIASTAGQYVFDHFADVTACDATVDCVSTYLASFAERAYRRPLAASESDSLNQQIADLIGSGSSAQEVAQCGVHGVLTAPGFLYRTELGDPSTATATDVALTPYEMASQLAFMLTGAPPDAQLLDAAKQGTLVNDAELARQVDRLLAAVGTQRNLSDAMYVRFKMNLVENVVVDATWVPGFTEDIIPALATESRMFMQDVLWQGPLGDLLTSTTAFVNTDIATFVYGVPAPTGATATDFVRVELPADQRVGLLTRPAYLMSNIPPSAGDNAVASGFAVASQLGCELLPPAPDTIPAAVLAMIKAATVSTERELAEQRMELPDCKACHLQMDPFGLALQNYDVIGRFTALDRQGRPIDSSATLPPSFDNQAVSGGVELSRAIARSHTFTACMAQTWLHYGLPFLPSLPALDSCVVNDVATRFAATPEQTFGALVREVARSPALTRRLLAN